MNSDWMPRRRNDRLAMAKVWITELPRANGMWTVTEAEISELEEHAEDLENAIDRANADPGSTVLATRAREAENALVRYMRFLHQRKFFSPPMKDSDWQRLGLNPRDTIRTSHIDVPEEVDFVLEIRGMRQVHVRFWVQGQTNMAKPRYYDGAVLVWGILDAPPADQDDLNEHTMASRTPHTIQFREEDRGKTVYVALRWQNERGLTGKWSDIKSAVIP